MRVRLRRSARVALGAIALTTGLIITPLASSQAFAHIGPCADDPILRLSDGTKVTLRATIGTDAAEVQAIVYTIDLPHGITVDRITYPGEEALQKVSTVIVSSTNPAGSGAINTDTVVTSSDNTATVTVDESVKNGGQKVDWQAEVSGMVNQDLMITYQGNGQSDPGQSGKHDH